jgi:hypothetical protein
MSLDAVQEKIAGEWTGENLLRLSWMSPSEFRSPSVLKVGRAAKGCFLSVTYTWAHENTPHEAFLLVGVDPNDKVATAAWVDSWHMNSKVMSLRGTMDDNGHIDLRGTYEAPPDPDWGWHIVLTAADGRLRMQMFNCPPGGGEDLAVQADYTRKSRE